MVRLPACWLDRKGLTCPVECPPPHRAPIAAALNRERPMVKGVRAAKWSGPARVWRQPARRPVPAAVAAEEKPAPGGGEAGGGGGGGGGR